MPTQTCATHLKVDCRPVTTKAVLLMHWQRPSIWTKTTRVWALDQGTIVVEGNWTQVHRVDLAFWDNRDIRSVTKMAHHNQLISVLTLAKPGSSRRKSIHRSSATVKVINNSILMSTGTINLRCRNLRSRSIASSGSSLTRFWTNNWCKPDRKAHTISSQVQPTSSQRLGKLIRWRRWNLPTTLWNHPRHCLSS